MKRVLCIATAVLLLGGCSAGSEGDNAPKAATKATPSNAAAASPSPATSASVAAEDPQDAIRSAAQAYSDAFLTGDGESAYALLSQRCRDRTAEGDFVGEVESAGDIYGKALRFDTFSAEVNGGQARVTYTYADNAEIDQDQEPWVREGGQWLEDDC